jgi:two-component system, NtrC family, sensor kinase
MSDPDSAGDSSLARRREILRQASVALHGRVVAMWEVSPRAEVLPILASEPKPPPYATNLDLSDTLQRWSAPIIQGSRWVGCRLDDAPEGRWCIAPVRNQPPAPPPGGVERRSRERMTLELAGLCLGLVDQAPRVVRPRVPETDVLAELVRQPSVIAHEVANPLTAALAGLDWCFRRVREAGTLDPAFRAGLLEDLSGVGEGMEQAIAFLRSIQDRARGGLARWERFDAAQVVRSCIALERPLARKKGIALEGTVAIAGLFLQGDPNALYQVLTNLIRNAVAASHHGKTPVVVTFAQAGDVVRLAVQDRGVGIAAEHRDRIFEPGFTTQAFGSGSGTGLTVVREITQEMFKGQVDVQSALGQGTTFTVTLPIPPQRASRAR